MFVEKWMNPDPVTVPPTTTISAAALLMAQHKYRHLLIAEPSGSGKKPLALLSKYDIALAFPSDLNPFSPEVTEATHPQPVSSIMTRTVITVPPDCAIEEAARILRSHHISALPVVRGDSLAGIITESNIFEALLDRREYCGHQNGVGVRRCDESSGFRHPTQRKPQTVDSKRHVLSRSAIGRQIVLVFHFPTRPDSDFVLKLCRNGFRLLTLV
jgi:CBS domain-containing protein